MRTSDHQIAIINDGISNSTLSHWDEHDDYPASDWMFEVANGDTRLGYWAWVIHKLECNDEGEPA